MDGAAQDGLWVGDILPKKNCDWLA